MFPRDSDQQQECIYKEQVKTNELLAQLIELLKPKESKLESLKTTVTKPVNRAKKPTTRRKAI